MGRNRDETVPLRMIDSSLHLGCKQKEKPKPKSPWKCYYQLEGSTHICMGRRMVSFRTLMLGAFSHHERNPSTLRLLCRETTFKRGPPAIPSQAVWVFLALFPDMWMKKQLSWPQPRPSIDCKLMREIQSENCLAYSQSTSKFESKTNGCYCFKTFLWGWCVILIMK